VGAPSLELRHLRYFVAVAEEKHFGRAAERLRIAQPGLSQQIKMLEQSLGTKLLIRDQRHVELTPAGETLLQHAYHLLALVDRAVEDARLSADGKSGVLTVGTPASGINSVANELLETFRARFPDAEVVLRPGFWPQNAEALRRGALDIAFVSGPAGSEDGLGYIRLGVAEVMVVLPESHPLAAYERIPRAALREEPFIALPSAADPIVVDDVHRTLFGDGEPPNLVESSDGAELTRVALVLQGKGLSATFLPAISELHIPGVAYRRIEEPAPFVEHGIVWVETTATELVSAFVDVARELAAGIDHSGGTDG
jgi:DNA-binding transcriptional LysR family regulator